MNISMPAPAYDPQLVEFDRGFGHIVAGRSDDESRSATENMNPDRGFGIAHQVYANGNRYANTIQIDPGHRA
jgi:hypothetical protein